MSEQVLGGLGLIESVWDYPRPPRIEGSSRELKVVHRGVTLAETNRSVRVLETSHPPVYYIPQTDIAMAYLVPSKVKGSYCEFKGVASYWTVDMEMPESSKGGAAIVREAAWSYAEPSVAYRMLKDHIAFYANKVDACYVDGERVQPQPGDFYGGWITSHVKGPFKGAPGTLGW